MATTEIGTESRSRQRIAGYVLVGLAGVVVVAIAVNYLGRPPQMGADDEVFRTVDALYTAVRMQDETQLTRCEERLLSYREAGKLPKESADYLTRVIAKARAGRWQPAAESLYDFMLAQRREGAGERSVAREEPVPSRMGKAKTGQVRKH